MDFLLKAEQLVVETKMARKGLTAKTLGEELIVDIAKYKVHPDCRTLVCFVYDPEGFVKNPKAIENDLTETHGEMPVQSSSVRSTDARHFDEVSRERCSRAASP